MNPTEINTCDHEFVRGFWETACSKCGEVKRDRFYHSSTELEKSAKRTREAVEALPLNAIEAFK